MLTAGKFGDIGPAAGGHQNGSGPVGFTINSDKMWPGNGCAAIK